MNGHSCWEFNCNATQQPEKYLRIWRRNLISKIWTKNKNMKMSAAEISQVLKEGELEKRSDNFLQFWKRKMCVLTTDSLNIYADSQKKSKSKELKLQSIKKVDCVERTGRFVYFTIVTTDNKEIDFRCTGRDSCWNAVITMALIDFQNRRAIENFKTRQDDEIASPEQKEKRMARGP
ncbi:pleckstrin homology-like domain family A member 2 [Brienomyrus brachyistius]|uniref:pleckstrin homology-like domain family A member 2 n=1 Tax=Brienomyrus brachyistius TaxID=42636 RepID=UPI0020B21955|nr:pleckstrin homology-like domain family A member 2 [Brienomyrus brachyistius]